MTIFGDDRLTSASDTSSTGQLLDGVWSNSNAPKIAASVPVSLGGPSNVTAPSSNPSHLKFTYDTIGQTIPRSIGHCRLPLKTIWVAGVDGTTSDGVAGADKAIASTADNVAGDTTVFFGYPLPSWLIAGLLVTPAMVVGGVTIPSTQSYTVMTVSDDHITISPSLLFAYPSGSLFYFVTVPLLFTSGASGLSSLGTASTVGIGTPAPTMTFAAALCEPIDPSELGNITEVFDGATQTYSLDGGGLTLPPDWSVTNQQQLAASLNGAIVYPGTEGQLPAALIVADKGASITNAFRGLRYIILQDYPIVGSGGTSLPRLSIVWRRSTTLARRKTSSNATAVTFASGAG